MLIAQERYHLLLVINCYFGFVTALLSISLYISFWQLVTNIANNSKAEKIVIEFLKSFILSLFKPINNCLLIRQLTAFSFEIPLAKKTEKKTDKQIYFNVQKHCFY